MFHRVSFVVFDKVEKDTMFSKDGHFLSHILGVVFMVVLSRLRAKAISDYALKTCELFV